MKGGNKKAEVGHRTYDTLRRLYELAIRLFLEETLSNDGYQVVAVSSGEEALPLLSGQLFDLALLDLILPGISGMEVLALLRQHAPDTIVILLTAHASLETAVEALIKMRL